GRPGWGRAGVRGGRRPRVGVAADPLVGGGVAPPRRGRGRLGGGVLHQRGPLDDRHPAAGVGGRGGGADARPRRAEVDRGAGPRPGGRLAPVVGGVDDDGVFGHLDDLGRAVGAGGAVVGVRTLADLADLRHGSHTPVFGTRGFGRTGAAPGSRTGFAPRGTA